MKKNYIFTLLMTICMTVASYGQYSDLFISMYAEGSSNNKFIEIYNGTGSDIDLSNYMIKGTNNGGDWKESRNLNLTGIITAGDVYVISTEDADASILAVADLSLSYDSPVHYNGDDAIALLKKNDSDVFEVIDIIGATGDDPGSGWAVAGVTNATKDHTLTRKNTISGPSSDWSSAGSDESSSQWVVTGKDTEWTSLGSYTAFIASTDPMDDFEGNGNITWAADGETGMDIAFANPSSTGINTSATVLEYTDAGGSDALKYANINFDLSTDTSIKYDLSTKNVFTLKVFVPTPDVAVTTGKTLALKLQDHSSSSPWEGQQVVSVAYEYDVWQELVFDFSAQSGATNFSRIVVQFNGENNTEAVKGYIDDLSYGEAVTSGVIDPMDDFEGNGNITWAADGETGMDIAFANPSSTGINTSATVLEYTDAGGSDALKYANINFDLSTDTSIKYDLSTKNVFTLKVFVPTPDVAVTTGKTLALKLQDHSSSSPWEGQQVVSVAYEYDVWQELVFDFSAQSGATNFSRIVVQFNGENNTEAVKGYIDDLSYGEAVTSGVIDPMDDFEGNGNITWAADGETGMDIAFANPSSTGINTSATVLEYTDAGGSDALKYANINFDLSTDTSIKYDLSTKNVFTLKVFVPTPDVAVTTGKTLALKLQDHSSSSPWEGQQVVSVAYEYDVWQELVFDFSAQSGATNFSRIVVQFNGENNTEAVKGYIDDLSYGEAVVADPTLPSVASPAVSASITGGTAGTNYISIYSDDLTSIAVDDLNPNWNQATSASEIQINGDNTLRYANLNYQGTTFNNDKQDVSGMTHLHIDYHTTNSTELQFFLIVVGVEEAYDIKANEGITTGSWVSLDIPLSNWTIDLATLREIKVVGNGTIYFDNWYFYDGATANVDSNNLLGFSMYPNPASNSLNISATETIQNAEIYNILGKNVMSVNVNDTKVTLDISNLASGMYIVKYKANDKIGTAKFIKK